MATLCLLALQVTNLGFLNGRHSTADNGSTATGYFRQKFPAVGHGQSQRLTVDDQPEIAIRMVPDPFPAQYKLP